MSNATWEHHNKSLQSSANNYTSSSTVQESTKSAKNIYHEMSGVVSSKNQSSRIEHRDLRNSNKDTNGFGHHGDLVVDGDGLGVVAIDTQVSVTITSEFGLTPLEEVDVEITGTWNSNG